MNWVSALGIIGRLGFDINMLSICCRCRVQRPQVFAMTALTAVSRVKQLNVTQQVILPSQPSHFRKSLILTQQSNNNSDITMVGEERFTEIVQQLRAQYEYLRDRSNFFGPSSKPIIEILTERVEGQDVESFWLQDGALVQFICLFDKPHTLSGDILRLNQNLSDISGSFEIDGDTVKHIDRPPPLPWYDDDTEDMTSALASLPTIQVDLSKHRVK